MPFPLAAWILQHHHLPHDLAESGMKGELRSAAPILRGSRTALPSELEESIASTLGVRRDRVVLTTGATTANTLVMLYLHRYFRRDGRRRPTAGLVRPEYPPLYDTAASVGFAVAPGLGGKDLAVLSNPNNPEGGLRTESALRQLTEGSRAVLVDETFREFSGARSIARRGLAGVWTTGTFTKVYGADDARIGFAVAPSGEAEEFRSAVDLWVDRPALRSVGTALALLRARVRIVAEAQGLFRRNLGLLQERVPEAPVVRAPVWFDRGIAPRSSLRLARAGLRRGVLVCPGHFFRDPSGVRVCLTRRSFPKDLEAYLQLRQAFRR